MLSGLVPLTHSRFNHIYKVLELFWGSKDFAEYLKTLVLTERSGREGFPPEIIKELFTLQLAHDKQFPEFVLVTVWDEYI